jgi:aerobic-type carbon monoxide dehydrogenase small subunit (CoxS/CutS family)
VERARRRVPTEIPRLRSPLSHRAAGALPYFTSGRVEMTVNGRPLRAEIEARTTLADLLRREGWPGAKVGCGTGRCGACTVLVDGRPVAACLQLAVRTQGRSVQTVEGLGTPDALHPVQAAFLEHGAAPCGYCAPAMLLSAKALLDAVPDPTEAEARDALGGCLCPCAGHAAPVSAVLSAARARP